MQVVEWRSRRNLACLNRQATDLEQVILCGPSWETPDSADRWDERRTLPATKPAMKEERVKYSSWLDQSACWMQFVP